MFTMLCINGTTPCSPSPPLWLYDFLLFLRTPGSSAPFRAGWGLGPSTSQGACLSPMVSLSLSHVLGVQWCIFLPPRHGAHAPRDTILSLVLAPGALYKELGEWGDTGNGNRAEAGAEMEPGRVCSWLPSLLPRTIPGIRTAVPRESGLPRPSRGPHGVMLCLYILYKGTCPFPL